MCGSRSVGCPTTVTSGRVCHLAADQVDQTSLPRGDLLLLGCDRLEGRGSGERAGDVLEARQPRVDPVVGGERRPPPCPLAHQEDADARRPAPLVRGGGRGRPPLRHRHTPGRRGGIGEHRHVVLGRQCSCLGERLERADLRVRHLYGDHAGRLLQGVRQPVEAQPPVLVHVDRRRRAAEVLLPPRAGGHHRRVLDRGVHQPGADAPAPEQQTEHAEVDSGRARGRERHLVGTDPQHRGSDLARVVEQQPRLAPAAVQPGGVGVPPIEGRQQGLPGRRMHRLGGRCVEVDGRLAHTRKIPPIARRRSGPAYRRKTGVPVVTFCLTAVPRPPGGCTERVTPCVCTSRGACADSPPWSLCPPRCCWSAAAPRRRSARSSGSRSPRAPPTAPRASTRCGWAPGWPPCWSASWCGA